MLPNPLGQKSIILISKRTDPRVTALESAEQMKGGGSTSKGALKFFFFFCSNQLDKKSSQKGVVKTGVTWGKHNKQTNKTNKKALFRNIWDSDESSCD